MKIPYVYQEAVYKELPVSFFKTHNIYALNSNTKNINCYSNNWRFKDTTAFFIQYGKHIPRSSSVRSPADITIYFNVLSFLT